MIPQIMIPSTVTAIDENAFVNCSRLTSVEFCDDIEQFVSGESIQDWWNLGVCTNSLSTYCFFAQRNVLERLGLVQRKWQINIHGMLRRIPAISPNYLNVFLIPSIPSFHSTKIWMMPPHYWSLPSGNLKSLINVAETMAFSIPIWRWNVVVILLQW